MFVLLLLMIFVGVIRKIRFERQESKKESLLLKMQEEREREKQAQKKKDGTVGASDNTEEGKTTGGDV